MDHAQIMQAIPHRYPFLFVDAMTECNHFDSAAGYKNVTLSEPFVYSQDPSRTPRFPESLVAESLAQVGAVAVLSLPENHGKIMLFAAVDNLRFYHPVYPGDQLVSRIRRIVSKGNLGKMKAIGFVCDRKVAEGEFTYALTDKQLRVEC